MRDQVGHQQAELKKMFKKFMKFCMQLQDVLQIKVKLDRNLVRKILIENRKDCTEIVLKQLSDK